MCKSAFITYFTKENRYSYNALLGALESTQQHEFVDVKFYDPKKSDDSLIDECLQNYEKVVFGFSFFTTQAWDVHRFVRHLNERYKNKLILIAGGPHPSGEPKSVLSWGFDYVFVGEGEDSVNEFFQALHEGSEINRIEGIYSKSEIHGYLYSPRKEITNLDKYYPFSEKYRKYGPIEITRGCPFACHFCQTTKLFGCNVRHRSISFIEELLEMFKRNGLKDFRAITPNALAYGSIDGKEMNLKAVHELLATIKRMLPEGRIFLGSFPSEVRPEHVTEDSIKLLCEYVDNDNLIMGAQTGSQRLLDYSHRGHTVSDVYNAVELCIRYKMTPNVDFMFGMPGESNDDVYQSIIVMNDLIAMGARIHAHTFMPLPQTPFASKGRGKVNEEIRQYIRKHVSKGAVYGDWAEQARLSQKIEKLLRTKKIDLDDA